MTGQLCDSAANDNEKYNNGKNSNNSSQLSGDVASRVAGGE